MLVVPENDVEKEANYAKLITFLALKLKNLQLTIKNGHFNSVVDQPKTIPLLGSKMGPPRITSEKSEQGWNDISRRRNLSRLDRPLWVHHR